AIKLVGEHGGVDLVVAREFGAVDGGKGVAGFGDQRDFRGAAGIRDVVDLSIVAVIAQGGGGDRAGLDVAIEPFCAERLEGVVGGGGRRGRLFTAGGEGGNSGARHECGAAGDVLHV